MSPGVRKLALIVHLTSSMGWIGAVIAYLVLGVTAVTNSDVETVRSAWTAMEVTGWWVIVPLAIAALLTGLVMSLGTQWGLFRHYWVLISLALTIVCTVVLVLHMPTVSAMASMARQADRAELRALGGDLLHPGVGLLVLLAITVLNVYKPSGVTPYGWRKQRQVRQALQRRTFSTISRAPVAMTDVRQPLRLSSALAGVGYFLFHLAEMWFAMMLGMMVFMPVRFALAALGYTVLLDASSLAFQAWMAAFMSVPMLAWMRIRGCGWRQGAEMSTGMLLPVAGVLMLRGLGLLDMLPWLTNSEHAAMLVGMLAAMLYRREHYTSGYSFLPWPAAAA